MRFLGDQPFDQCRAKKSSEPPGDGKFVYVSNRGHDSISATWTNKNPGKEKEEKHHLEIRLDHLRWLFFGSESLVKLCEAWLF